jgi:hypothetical protein
MAKTAFSLEIRPVLQWLLSSPALPFQYRISISRSCLLVANAVVYYNTLILSEILDELQKRGEVATIEAIKRLSPIAWQHINFYGHYLFDADFSPIDMAAIRQHLSSEEVRRFYVA